MNEPIDRLHVEIIEARSLIRSWFASARAEVYAWSPRPCPPKVPRS